MTLTLNTTANGALFTEKPTSPNMPIMSGNIEIDSIKIALAAFLKQSRSSGNDYLNLKLTISSDKTVYGRLFRNNAKSSANAPDYSGFIDLESGKLRVSGWRVTSSEKRTYISLAIQPEYKSLNDLPI